MMFHMANHPLVIKNSIVINAPAAHVWKVLTVPKYTKEYMYDCEALSDWKVGSPLLWKGAQDGKIYVKGVVTVYREYTEIRYTVIDPNDATLEDIPSNYTTVTYELRETNGVTTFFVTQGDFGKIKNGERRWHDAMKSGWDSVVKKIKEVAEK